MSTDENHPEIDLAAAALEAASCVLVARWPRERCELFVESAASGFSRLFERPHYQAHVAVFEPATLMAVELVDDRVARIFAAPRIEEAELEPLAPELEPVALDAVVSQLKDATATGQAHAHCLGARPGRDERVNVAFVQGFTRAPDGVVVVDLDARTGENLGHHAAPFLRGSRSGNALSQPGVVARVREALSLREGDADLVKASLDDSAMGRAWRLRFDLTTEHQEGFLLVTAHARSGVVAGLVSTVRPRHRLGPPPDRDVALGEARRAARALLGEGSRVDGLVQGGVLARRGTDAQPGWLGAAVSLDGQVARVAVIHGWVELSVSGKRHRMPTVG